MDITNNRSINLLLGVDNMMNGAHTYPIKQHVTLFSVNFQIGKQLCMKCPCQASESKRKVAANADIMSQVIEN